jgi:hypothetical protein
MTLATFNFFVHKKLIKNCINMTVTNFKQTILANLHHSLVANNFKQTLLVMGEGGGDAASRWDCKWRNKG